MPATGRAEWDGNMPTAEGTFTAGNTVRGGGRVPGLDEVVLSKHCSATKDGFPARSALAGLLQITLNPSVVR
jgi:hypothetical protein